MTTAFTADSGATVHATTNSELFSALNTLSANGGGTITLDGAGGPYSINAFGKGSADGMITIVSADADSPAVFTAVTLDRCKNIAIDGVTFDSSELFQSRAGYVDDLNIRNSQNIAVRNSHFESTADGFRVRGDQSDVAENIGKITDSSGITLSGNSMTGYFQGLSILDCVDVVVSDNDISRMQGDGLRFSGVVNTLVENNRLTDFLGSTNDLNHDDMIQVFQTGASNVTENLTIRGNYLDSGDGAASQSIFIRNEAGEPYRNLLIEDNVIINGHLHGIAVMDVVDTVIQNNTLLWDDNAMKYATAESAGVTSAPGIRAEGDNITVEGNIVGRLIQSGDVTLNNNRVVDYGNGDLRTALTDGFDAASLLTDQGDSPFAQAVQIAVNSILDEHGSPAPLLASADSDVAQVRFNDGTAAVLDDGASGQDEGRALLHEDGSGVTLVENAWKAIEIDLTITEDSVLRFDFASGEEGEIHGIGFTRGDQLMLDALFQLDGTQSVGLQDFNGQYETGSGAQSYEIRLSEHLSGSYDRLVLVMDNDASDAGDSSFANLELIEEAPFAADEFRFNEDRATLIDAAVSGQDEGQALIHEDHNGVTLVENAWKGIDIDLTITEDSVLRFDFASGEEGEIHGIGFTRGDQLMLDALFQLDGTQRVGLQEFNGQYETGSGMQSYEIALDDYISGSYDRLVLVMDNDASLAGDSSFANIEIL